MFLAEELLLTLFRHHQCTKASFRRAMYSLPLDIPPVERNILKYVTNYIDANTSDFFTRPCANDSRFLPILLVFAIRQRRSRARRCVGTFIGHFEGEARPISTVNGRTSNVTIRQSTMCVWVTTFLKIITDGYICKPFKTSNTLIHHGTGKLRRTLTQPAGVINALCLAEFSMHDVRQSFIIDSRENLSPPQQ